MSAAPLGDESRGPDSSRRVAAETVSAWHACYARDLDAFLRGLLRNRDLAAEALQNTFQRALEAGHTVQAQTVKGWLFKVAYHEAMRLRRQQATDDHHLHQFAQKVKGQSLGEAGVTARLFQEEHSQRVRAALEELPAEQREIIERRIYREQTFAAIASELRLPIGTVLTRMRLALEKLQRRLRSSE